MSADLFSYDWLHSLATLCALAAALGVAYLAVASILVLRFPGVPRPRAARPPAISILVPLCNEDPALRGRLAALCAQIYAAPVEVICGAQDPTDPAIGIVEAAGADFSPRAVELVVDPAQHGGNRKVSNLINMARLARREVLVLVDSDILVGPTYLDDLAGELERPGVGAVSCLYHGVGGAGLWSRLAALDVNTHFLPGAITGLEFGIAHPCFGATIALSRSTLEAIGGLPAFADRLHDDYAIGASVRAAGWDVAIPRFSVGHVCRERNAREFIANQIRSARTIRMIDPIGYAGSLITHPFPLALIALLLGGPHAGALLMLALCGRLLLCLCAERAFALSRQAYWLLPLRDLLSFFAYGAACFGARIEWRGERYRLNPDGALIQEPE